MYDAHYDLLTSIYFNFKKSNPKSNKEKLINDCINIYKEGNVDGGIINLYFMSSYEMYQELGITKSECQNVKDMFKTSINNLRRLQDDGVIPKNKKFIFSIEGCDFINNPVELLDLYNEGLRAILPVWNNENKFGSGNRKNHGLSYLGKELIKLAINLGIAIDLSHANKQTFSDIMDMVEMHILKGEQPVILASHSNARKICNRSRNLTDEQIKRLKNAGGYLGLFSNCNFVSLKGQNISKKERKQKYLEMISYVVDDLKYPKDRILLATDDMNFNPDCSYHGLETFDIYNIRIELKELLLSKFDVVTTQMFMKTNFEDLYSKLNPVKYKDFDKNNINRNLNI